MAHNLKDSMADCPPHIAMFNHPPAAQIRGRLSSGTGVVFGLLGAATLAGLLFVTVSPRADANPRHAVGVLMTAGALLAAMAAALAFRLERVTVDGNEITQEKSLVGIAWKRRRMARAGVNALRVQARGPGGRGLAIIGPHGRLLVGSSLEEPELEWLRNWVSRQLGK